MQWCCWDMTYRIMIFYHLVLSAFYIISDESRHTWTWFTLLSYFLLALCLPGFLTQTWQPCSIPSVSSSLWTVCSTCKNGKKCSQILKRLPACDTMSVTTPCFDLRVHMSHSQFNITAFLFWEGCVEAWKKSSIPPLTEQTMIISSLGQIWSLNSFKSGTNKHFILFT